MRRDKKGMTMALGVIIAIVVLIVVALAVIAITSGSLSRFFGTTDNQQKYADVGIKCQTWFGNWCLNHPGQEPASDDYPSYDIVIGDVTETIVCSDGIMLGDKKCTGVSPTP